MDVYRSGREVAFDADTHTDANNSMDGSGYFIRALLVAVIRNSTTTAPTTDGTTVSSRTRENRDSDNVDAFAVT